MRALGRHRCPGLDRSSSPSPAGPASWWRSPRSTTRPCSSCTSWRRLWRRATRSGASRPVPTPLDGWRWPARLPTPGGDGGAVSVIPQKSGPLAPVDAPVTVPRVLRLLHRVVGRTATGEHITNRRDQSWPWKARLSSRCLAARCRHRTAAATVAARRVPSTRPVCISVQRVITHPAVAADFLDALVPKVERS